ncbi:GRIP and coiled-coil domain-containing protein 2 isoform X2 [Rosa chinensis]|uniref:GRIP and coiled-coil domain-containing protein 2 isoform X1 n=1 Tax=Rosa chinensis TaxID=74649 RepID=UPI000D087B9E|nr:GRIP and coiled-coil domain-containing protein 2 isoform X1 [Rosa chinensis]XP_024188705.1 GRIP and coiled-coil domain-containing protein 2 isoform X2 [Rosa chinensis]
MEKMTLDSKEYELKKNSMRKMYESLHSQASSMLVFTLQWKELEGCLDSIRDATQTRLEELHEREQQLDAKELKMESKANEFQEREKQLEAKELKIQSEVNEAFGLEKLIKEKQTEALDSKNYLNSLQLLIKEHTESEKELGAKERQIERRIQELNGVERNIEEKLKKSREELNQIQRGIKEQGVEFDLKEKQIKVKEEKLNRIEKNIEEKLKLAIEEEKKAFDPKQERVTEEQKLREERLQEEEKLKEHKKSVVDASKTLKSREEIKRELELKVKDHCSRKKSMEEWSCNLERKERELELKEKQVLSKAEELDSLNKRTLNEFQLMEKELSSVESTIQEREKKLEAASHRLQVKERQLELKSETMEKLQQECKKQLEARERQLEVKGGTMEKLHQEREKKLEVKERLLEEQSKELELTKKQFGCQMKVKSEPLENTPAANNAIVSSSASDHSKINIRDGRGLQLFMYEHMKRNDSVSKEISAVLQQESLEPAKLVLDAMAGFHPSNSTVDNREFDLVIIRRTCILLLEELKRVSAQINPQVREQAIKLAGDWKAKMTVGTENWLEVLGFLRLVTTYELTSAYDANELQGLLDIVAQHEQATELSRALGTTDKAAPDVETKNAKSSAAAIFSSPNLQPATTVPANAIIAIQNFIREKKLVKAYGRIHKFKLLDKFPPAQVLKEYVEKAMKCMENSERKDMLHQQDEVVDEGISDLRRAIECIKYHNLESEYPSESIEKQIVVLQKFMEDRKKQNQKKRLCSTIDSSFQQQEHKFQRTSLSAGRPYGLHPVYPNPGSSFYNGQFSIPSNNPVQFSMPANGVNYEFPRIYPFPPYPRPLVYRHPGYGLQKPY